MKFVCLFCLFLFVSVFSEETKPQVGNDFTFFGKVLGKDEEFTLYYDSTGKRMLQVKPKSTVFFTCNPGSETTTTITPEVKECKIGCLHGKKCDGEKCRGCFLPDVWEKYPSSKRTEEECENSYGIKGIKFISSEKGNEFCFSKDTLTPVYLQHSGGGKTIRYDVKSYQSGRPNEDNWNLPDYCKCPKVNPFKLLNRY